MVFASRKIVLLLGVALLVVCSLAAEEESAETAPTCDAPTCKEPNTEGDAEGDVEGDAEGDVEGDAEGFDEDFDEDFDEGHLEGFDDEDEEFWHRPPPPLPDNIPDMDNLPPPKIPDMTHGGVVVYFHLYKTGGSSITELVVETKSDLEEDEPEEFEEKVFFYNNREDMSGEDIQYSVTMARNKGVKVFYNFHVEYPNTLYPTLVEAATVINGWREYSESHGVPFFATTVLREPLGHALSFFNFFHVVVEDQEWSPFQGYMAPTEENFLKTYVPNRLCHLMFDDAHGILEAPEAALREGVLDDIEDFLDEDELNRLNEPSYCDEEVVRKILFGGTFDYVGVTEYLTPTILPMFMEIVFGDHELAYVAEKKKDINEMFDEDELPPLKKHNLTEATKEMVARESAKDQRLYEEARDRFAHWPKYS